MKALVRGRAYLNQNRRSLIGRSLAAGIAGVVPIPVLEDWLVSSIRRSMIQRIAESHGIDISKEAVAAIADGKEEPPRWVELVGGGLALRLLSKQWKKIFMTVFAAKQAQAVTMNFEVATLFDHYCARVHVGMGLTKHSGKHVRALIDKARKETKGNLSTHLFRKGLLGAAKQSIRTPMEIAKQLGGERITRFLVKDNEVEATTEVDQALEDHLKSKNSFLSRSAAAIDFQISVESNPYLDTLIEAFDALFAKEENSG